MVNTLLVEDNPGDVRLISELLKESGHDAVLSSVASVNDAIERLSSDDIDVVLLDLGLPDSQGMETLKRVQEVAASVPVIVLTGNIDTRLALAAVQSGAQDYLVKGHFDGEVLGRVIGYSIGRKAIEDQLRVSQSDLLIANAQLEHMVYDVVEAMGQVVEYRDPYTQGHQVRVAALSLAIAEEMGCDGEVTAAVHLAGLVHDIGKLSVPAEILSKPGRLSPVELMLVREHPAQGFEILKSIAFPWPIATIVLQHHERIDGSGYPAGLHGGDMLPGSRIMAVADVVEAMASHRPYRPAHPVADAVAEVVGHRECFDPDVVDACVRLHEAGRLGL